MQTHNHDSASVAWFSDAPSVCSGICHRCLVPTEAVNYAYRALKMRKFFCLVELSLVPPRASSSMLTAGAAASAVRLPAHAEDSGPQIVALQESSDVVE